MIYIDHTVYICVCAYHHIHNPSCERVRSIVVVSLCLCPLPFVDATNQAGRYLIGGLLMFQQLGFTRDSMMTLGSSKAS